MGGLVATFRNVSDDAKLKESENVDSSEMESFLAQLKKINEEFEFKHNNFEYKETDRKEIDSKKLIASLSKFKDDERFKKYNTYDLIYRNMPSFVIIKQRTNDPNARNYYPHGPAKYYDVYKSNDKMKENIMSIMSQKYNYPKDIILIILLYLPDTELLFCIKKQRLGAMTLSTDEITVGDKALFISDTYSEKRGRSGHIKLNNNKYDKKIFMYIGCIINELSSYEFRILSFFSFNFNQFMFYEIEGNQRPPPKKSTYCIYGNCLIKSWDCANNKEIFKQARDIRAGDIIVTSNGKLVKVICSVTQIINDIIDICQVGENGLCLITPEHPYREICNQCNLKEREKEKVKKKENEQREWKIPYKERQCIKMFVDQVNNFILESNSEHHVVIDNIECITLGHMFDDPIVKHDIWGTNVICQFLQSMQTYPNVIVHGTLKNGIEKQLNEYYQPQI